MPNTLREVNSNSTLCEEEEKKSIYKLIFIYCIIQNIYKFFFCLFSNNFCIYKNVYYIITQNKHFIEFFFFILVGKELYVTSTKFFGDTQKILKER